jgi:hypothetical protein
MIRIRKPEIPYSSLNQIKTSLEMNSLLQENTAFVEVVHPFLDLSTAGS